MKVFSWALVAAASLQSAAAFLVSCPAFSLPGSSSLRMSDDDDWIYRETSNVDEGAVNDLLAERVCAKKRWDFDTADQICDQLLS
jgi:hypothetical protein